jgi:hypothetical protein
VRATTFVVSLAGCAPMASGLPAGESDPAPERFAPSLPPSDPISWELAPQSLSKEPGKSDVTAGSEAEQRSMHARLQSIRVMTVAVVEGDDERARELARSLGEHLRSEAAKEEAWEVHLTDVLRHADAVGKARSHDDVAEGIAQLARSCGACHAQLLGEVTLPRAPHLERGESIDAIMQQHAWAANRMWEGLVAASVERWTMGTGTFAALPRCEQTLPEGGEIPVCARVRSLANRAHVADEWATRTRLFGELLAGCGECHESR